MVEYPHVIIIESFEKIDDDTGGHTEDWMTWKEAEANVQPVSGDEFYQAQQLQVRIAYNVFLPYIDGVTSTMRVKYGKLIMKIVAPIDQGGCNEVLLLKCSL